MCMRARVCVNVPTSRPVTTEMGEKTRALHTHTNTHTHKYTSVVTLHTHRKTKDAVCSVTTNVYFVPASVVFLCVCSVTSPSFCSLLTRIYISSFCSERRGLYTHTQIHTHTYTHMHSLSLLRKRCPSLERLWPVAGKSLHAHTHTQTHTYTHTHSLSLSLSLSRACAQTYRPVTTEIWMQHACFAAICCFDYFFVAF